MYRTQRPPSSIPWTRDNAPIETKRSNVLKTVARPTPYRAISRTTSSALKGASRRSVAATTRARAGVVLRPALPSRAITAAVAERDIETKYHCAAASASRRERQTDAAGIRCLRSASATAMAVVSGTHSTKPMLAMSTAMTDCVISSLLIATERG